MSATPQSFGGPNAPTAWNTVQTQLRCCRTPACHIRYPDNGHHHCCSRCRLGGGRDRHSRRCRQVQRDLVQHPPTMGTMPPSTALMVSAPSMASTTPATNMASSSTTPCASANLGTGGSWGTAHTHRWSRSQRPGSAYTSASAGTGHPHHYGFHLTIDGADIERYGGDRSGSSSTSGPGLFLGFAG